MSTQIRKPDCIGWEKPRPYLVPHFIGFFTPEQSTHPDRCYDTAHNFNDPSRRYDERIIGGKKPTYGKGVPKMNSYTANPVSNTGTGDKVMYNTYYTAEGPVKLPVNFLDISKNNFLPSISDITSLQTTDDTRLQHKPDRYYR